MQKNRTTSAGLKRNVSDQQGHCLLTDELLPIFTSEKPSHVTDLFPIKCLVAKCSSSFFFWYHLLFQTFIYLFQLFGIMFVKLATS